MSIPLKIAPYARKFVTELAKTDTFAPVIALESTVITGRTYHAYKRGGIEEARERGIEETLGAVFWLLGIQGFNKLGDQVGKRMFKRPVDVDIATDGLRKPLNAYLHDNKSIVPKKFTAFKFAKVSASVLLANAFVGLIVPKFNQNITKHFLKKNSQANQNNKETNSLNAKKQPMASSAAPASLVKLTHLLEKDATVKLISTDLGIAVGRSVSSRNASERNEILFRDLSSIYFYMLCRHNVNSALNFMQDKRTTRLNATTAKQLHDHISNGLTKDIDVRSFRKLVLGNENAKINPNLKFTKVDKSNLELIKLNDFINVEKNSGLVEAAKKMSKLQPIYHDGAVLTKQQVESVYKGGLINKPEFLKTVYETATGGESTNKYRYVAQKDLDNIYRDMTDYVDDICKKTTKSGTITKDILKKANKMNFVKNAANLGTGFVISSFFLSTAIPKIQYWITKKMTGKDEFPGIAGLKTQA